MKCDSYHIRVFKLQYKWHLSLDNLFILLNENKKLEYFPK